MGMERLGAQTLGRARKAQGDRKFRQSPGAKDEEKSRREPRAKEIENERAKGI